MNMSFMEWLRAIRFSLCYGIWAILELSCKTPNSEMSSKALATSSQKGSAIVAVAKFASVGEAINEHQPSFKACIGSGQYYRACGGYIDLKKKCPHPSRLIVRPKETDDESRGKRCHRFVIVNYGDGSVSMQTLSSVEPRLTAMVDKPNCLAVSPTNDAIYKACDSEDESQRFSWDKGENGGYGYIKWPFLGGSREKEKCLDVARGGSDISGDTILQFAACKPYSAGPVSDSNNQRFYLEP